MEGVKEIFIPALRELQDEICRSLEAEDGLAKFASDNWERPGGGGGCTRVIQNGKVFEKGGVNFSEVSGLITPVMESQLKINGHSFLATGLSIVLHPFNPFVPTIHANFRYLEIRNKNEEIIDSWFGGGTDLTPYYLVEEDAKHFHGMLKNVCDEFDTAYYPEFKDTCDNYFVNTHRGNERRGIGGIFFDYRRTSGEMKIEDWMKFAIATAKSFLPAYLPIVQRRKKTAFNEEHKFWQEIRRGRYVEFNLVHDRGTLFGLKTNGRTESILMSLPPTVRFNYNYQPAAGTEEAQLLEVCLHPRQWV
jgi:coproporphyrinogen III oxidase